MYCCVMVKVVLTGLSAVRKNLSLFYCDCAQLEPHDCGAIVDNGMAGWLLTF